MRKYSRDAAGERVERDGRTYRIWRKSRRNTTTVKLKVTLNAAKEAESSPAKTWSSISLLSLSTYGGLWSIRGLAYIS